MVARWWTFELNFINVWVLHNLIRPIFLSLLFLFSFSENYRNAQQYENNLIFKMAMVGTNTHTCIRRIPLEAHALRFQKLYILSLLPNIEGTGHYTLCELQFACQPAFQWTSTSLQPTQSAACAIHRILAK